MSEAEKEQASLEDERATVRVNDRRRFDMDGNVRPEAEELRGQEPESQARSGSTAAPEAQSAKLQQELDVARKRVDELARAFQALSSDREEFKQRLTRERERMIDVEKGNIA